MKNYFKNLIDTLSMLFEIIVVIALLASMMLIFIGIPTCAIIEIIKALKV